MLRVQTGEHGPSAGLHEHRDGATGDWTYEVARHGDGSIAVVVQDWGSWRPPPADPGFRGRGVEFVRHLADEVDFERGDTGTTVRFRLGPPDGPGAPRSAAPVERDELGPSVAEVRGELDLALGFEGMFRLPDGRPPLLRIRDVPVGRLKVSTLTMGEGPEDVLLLHGLGGTKSSFFDTAAALSREVMILFAIGHLKHKICN